MAKTRRKAKKNFNQVWKLGRREYSTDTFHVNKDGELVIREGNFQYNVHDLVRKLGSPVEFFMPFILEKRLNQLLETANKTIKKIGYRGNFAYHFPMKVNQNKECVLPLISEGAHLEVASANDLWVVQKMWEEENFSKRIRVCCNGPKTPEYLDRIHLLKKMGLSIIPIIEDDDELKLLKGFSGELGIRINLQSKVQSHWDKKVDRFGLLLDEIMELGHIRNLKILHYHIGSQINREADMLVALKEAYTAYKKIRAKNPTLDTLNLGGGFAIPYEKKKMYSMESVVSRVFRMLKKMADKDGIPHPNVLVEWGRYIAAPAQITVYKIIGRKEIHKAMAKEWYIIDGSFMNDLLDTWAIHQKWHIAPVNEMNAKRRHRVWLAGLSCDSDDRYASRNGYLLMPRLDDLNKDEDLYVAVFDTGAYQDAFTSRHCLLSGPAKVSLQNGSVTVIRKRDKPEDIARQFGW